MGKKQPDYIWVFLGMIVIFIAIVRYPDVIGLDTAIGTTLTSLWPTLLLTCIAVYMFAKAKKPGKFGGMMCLGLAACLFLDQANTQGLITADMLTGLTVQQLQIWTMIISIFTGAIAFGFKR